MKFEQTADDRRTLNSIVGDRVLPFLYEQSLSGPSHHWVFIGDDNRFKQIIENIDETKLMRMAQSGDVVWSVPVLGVEFYVRFRLLGNNHVAVNADCANNGNFNREYVRACYTFLEEVIGTYSRVSVLEELPITVAGLVITFRNQQQPFLRGSLDHVELAYTHQLKIENNIKYVEIFPELIRPLNEVDWKARGKDIARIEMSPDYEDHKSANHSSSILDILHNEQAVLDNCQIVIDENGIKRLKFNVLGHDCFLHVTVRPRQGQTVQAKTVVNWGAFDGNWLHLSLPKKATREEVKIIGAYAQWLLGIKMQHSTRHAEELTAGLFALDRNTDIAAQVMPLVIERPDLKIVQTSEDDPDVMMLDNLGHSCTITLMSFSEFMVRAEHDERISRSAIIKVAIRATAAINELLNNY